MGCTSSKQSVCRNCHAPYSPVRRSFSAHAHRSPPREGDNRHVVVLTSTTLGYLQLDPSKPNQVRQEPPVRQVHQEPIRRNVPEKNSKDFAVGVIEAKTWSMMMDDKIPKVVPKTPIRTPPGEPETINAWELMEGLDDTSPLQPPSAVNHIRSFSFNVNPNSIPPPLNALKSQEKDQDAELSRKPLWLQLAENHSDSTSDSYSSSNDKSIALDFDPEVITAFRKSLESLPPANPFHLKPLQNGTMSRGKEKLILYFTSLRGVRKTYEDCCHVRVILKGTGIRVDERDVSMHSGFKEELQELLGDRFSGGGLPKVFVGKKYIGGADEIRRLHEDCQLDKVLEGCEMVDDGGGGGGGCEACGDIRFLPCETCSGSCKIYYEADCDEGDKEEEEESDYGFQRCPDCNENGLVRCPICCD